MSAVWPGLVTFMFPPVFWLLPIYFIPGYTWHRVHGNHEDGLSHVWGSPVAKDIQGMWGVCLFLSRMLFEIVWFSCGLCLDHVWSLSEVWNLESF